MGWLGGCAAEADKGLLRARTSGREPFDLAFCCLRVGGDVHKAKCLPSSSAKFKHWQAVFINVGSLVSWASLRVEREREREDSSF